MSITYIHTLRNRAAGQGARRIRVVNANHIASDQSACKHSVYLAEGYNNLSLERAREKYMYTADIYGLLVSVNHLHQGLIALPLLEQVVSSCIFIYVIIP